ncbi:MAG TPA: extensin family protein [Polyangiaceae bacterium]|nr:extensin family protein [Polyangiaceae bacterium]
MPASGVRSASPLAIPRGEATTRSTDGRVPPDDGVSRLAPAALTEPTSSPPPAEPVQDPGLANLDPADDQTIGAPDAIPDCHERLRAAGVTFREAKLPIVKKRGFVCGAPQAVEYQDGPEHIRFRPRPVVTCQLALALAHFEGVINRTASELLGARVTSVTQGGTYSCRAMARFKLVSEHSYGNAIDLYAFGLSDGRTVSVLKHFGNPSSPANNPESRFLRTLGQRLFDENVFSVVVTRFFDELHRDHIHVDMAHYRTDGSRS